MSQPIIIGSRGSDLALWQANFTKDALESLGHQVEIVIIKTQGDRIQHLSFDKMEGKGFFTKELEEALLQGTIDLAVHSHKDLPTTNPEGLEIAAVSYREDCSESILIRPEAYDSNAVFSLKQGAVVGTSSLRRKSQLIHQRPGLDIIDLRGNVPTRIQKLVDGQYDAILLASAGLNRLNLAPDGIHRVQLPVTSFIPAPAQGVLAFQMRENDDRIRAVLQSIHHADVQETISIERAVLNRLDGGCQLPLGVYCEKNDSGFHTWVSLQPLDGSAYRRFYRGSDSTKNLVDQLLHRIQAKESRNVFYSRNPEDASLFIKQVQSYGFQVDARSPLQTQSVQVDVIPFTDWIFFTSKKGVEHYFEQELMIPAVMRVAALGSGTAASLHKYGITPSFIGSDGDVEQTAQDFLKIVKGKSVLFPIGDAGLRSVQTSIEQEVECIDLIVYSSSDVDDFAAIEAEIAVFTSPASVKAASKKTDLSKMKCVAIGKRTSLALIELGCQDVVESYFTTEQALSDLVCGLD